MSDYQFPDDEFDAADADGPAPVGVHRAQVPAWRSWIPLLVVLIVVPLVAWGAVALLKHGAAQTSGGSGNGSTGTGAAPAPDTPAASEGGSTPGGDDTPEPDSSGSADLTAGITVHNGTDVTGLAGRAGGKFENVGFTSVVVADGVYTETDPATTTIFYAAPEDAATAKAVADALGVSNVVESAEATGSDSGPITVILRDDYHDDDQG